MQCLYAELPSTEMIPIDRLDRFIEEVSALRGGQAYQAAGMLSEWWQVFWSILSGGVSVTSVNSGANANASTMIPSAANSTTTVLPASQSQSKTPISARPLKIPINKDISAVTRKPFPRPPILAPKNNLDVEALAAIERSLTAVGLMNRDLTRLSGEEKAILSAALRNNRVSIDAWTSYLQLCQEYTRNGSRGPSIAPVAPSSSSAPIASGVTVNQAPPLSNAPAVIIDQETRPVDSRQILWLRQNLYHQYMMRNAAFSANMSMRSFPNSSEVSPLLINAPQLPLESPFYSPPRKLEDFAPLRSANFDVPLTGESVEEAKQQDTTEAEEAIEGGESADAVEDCLNPDLPLDLFDVDFGNAELMAAFTGVSSASTSTGDQGLFELPGFDFYSSNTTNTATTSSANNSTTDSFSFTDDLPVLIHQQQQQNQKQQEEDLHYLMSEFLDVNNM